MGNGAGLRFLSEAVASPSLEAVRDHVLARFPQAKWVEYEPLDCDQARAGAELAFKTPLVPQYHFDRADVVVGLDCDFLGQDAPTLSAIRAFTRRRRMDAPGDSMNRLYIVEGRHSMTGAVADHRIRMAPSEVRQFAEDLARELRLVGAGLNVLPSAPDSRRKWLAAVARDLEGHRGRCLVLAGPRQPAEVHALAHWINQALGAAGVTVTYSEPPKRPALTTLSSLAAEISAGQVETLVILGGNPAFNAPADLGFAALLRKVPTTIRLGLEEDETSAGCSWHLPAAHFLESWSDGRAADGTASVQQPLIEPLYGGRTAAEVLALLGGYKDRRAYDIVHNYWLTRWPAADGERTWLKALHDGVIPGTPFPEVKAAVDTARVQAALQAKPLAAARAPGVEVAFYPGWASWDGRFANNGWLQETPDPMTRLTWDNAALISPGDRFPCSGSKTASSWCWPPAAAKRRCRSWCNRATPTHASPSRWATAVRVAGGWDATLGLTPTRCARAALGGSRAASKSARPARTTSWRSPRITRAWKGARWCWRRPWRSTARIRK